MPLRMTDRPVLQWVVFKVVQRCNLDCRYCYVYHRGDDSWRDRPAFVHRDVVTALAQRILEHCRMHGLTRFTVELHGGEPLLLGRARMKALIEELRSVCAGIEMDVVLQTNGLLLDEVWLEFFDRYGVTFGVSLDGPPQIADRNRIMRDGQGSTARLLQVLARLRQDPRFAQTNGGVLCVVDPTVDARMLTRWFAESGFTALDYLLPDGNHANPPAGWSGPEPYRRFLIEAFEAWHDLPAERPLRIRTFEAMIAAQLGARWAVDALGGDLRWICVVESDGSLALSDVARICGGRFAVDELSVFRDALEDIHGNWDLEALQAPPDECRACPFLPVTGGGYFPHRFDGEGFRRPSIYCPALCGFAGRIHEQLKEDLPTALWSVADRQ